MYAQLFVSWKLTQEYSALSECTAALPDRWQGASTCSMLLASLIRARALKVVSEPY